MGEVRHFHRVLEHELPAHEEAGWLEWARERVLSMPNDPVVLIEWDNSKGEPRLPDDTIKPIENTIGHKDDAGKPEFSQVPRGTLIEVARVLTDGAKHYGSDDNWKRVPNPRKRYYDAACRHLDSWWNGELIDPNSGRPHLAHAIADLMFLLWFQLNEHKEK